MAHAARQALTEAAVRQPGIQSSNGDTDERDVGQIAGPATAIAPPPLPCVRMPCQRSWAGLRGCDRMGGTRYCQASPDRHRSHRYPFAGVFL